MPWEYSVRELAEVIEGSVSSAKDVKFNGVSIDTRKLLPGQVFFALPGAKVDGHNYVQDAINKGAPIVVVSKDVDVPNVKVKDTLRALQRFARWHRKNYPVKVFGITGSCGKTTSKELVFTVLSKKYNVISTQGNYNNEIGCPLSLLNIDSSTEWAVIEMGAGKPGDIAELCGISFPDESAITVIGPAHLERLGSVEGVAIEKGKIAECLPPWGHFYVNSDDRYVLDIAKRISVSKTYYGTQGNVILKSYRIVSDELMEIDVDPVGKLKIPLCSPSHISNFLLAITVALKHEIQIDEKELFEAYYRAGRIKILEIDGFYIIDDSYNANPLSVSSSLDYLLLKSRGGFKCAVLGDMLELGEESEKWHTKVGREVARKGIDILFIYGNFSEKVKTGAEEVGLREVYCFDSHDEIVKAIRKKVPKGAWVLVKGSRGMQMEKVIEYLMSR